MILKVPKYWEERESVYSDGYVLLIFNDKKHTKIMTVSITRDKCDLYHAIFRKIDFKTGHHEFNKFEPSELTVIIKEINHYLKE